MGPARRPGAEEARRPVASAVRREEVGAQQEREARTERGCQAHSNRGRVGGHQGGSGRVSDPKPRPLAAARSSSLLEGRHGGREAVHQERYLPGEENGNIPPRSTASPFQSHPKARCSFPASAESQAPPLPEVTPPAPVHLRPCLPPRYPPTCPPSSPSCAPSDPSVPTKTPTLDSSLGHHPAPARSFREFHRRDSQRTGSPSRASSATGLVPSPDAPPLSQAWRVPLIRPVPRGVRRLLQEAFLKPQRPSPSHQACNGAIQLAATTALTPGAQAILLPQPPQVAGITAAKIAGLYDDSEPPRKTVRRGVLMTLLQQSAMTLPLWIGKPGPHPSVGPSPPQETMWPDLETR
ncbi:proline-rich protein 36-like isoform X2 [Pongo pygmaeus]|uniref:proline-rich protein 36-like isoform X2 n=1 Tax=Pongo pygmaeus TaxID=9600 RepID=UPI00300C492A